MTEHSDEKAAHLAPIAPWLAEHFTSGDPRTHRSTCTCGWEGPVRIAEPHQAWLDRCEHVGAALDAEIEVRVARAAREGLAVAEHLLRKVADYWDGRPVEHHGHHIYADLLDVLRAITPSLPSAPEETAYCQEHLTVTCRVEPGPTCRFTSAPQEER